MAIQERGEGGGWKEADWEIMQELSLGLTEPRRFSGGATKATP